MPTLDTSTLRQGLEGLHWALAEQCAADLAAGYTEGRIAADTGLSASQVRQYAQTYRAFPRPEDRAEDLPFDVHVTCAKTATPQEWLDWAVAQGAKKRTLQRAIKEAEGVLPEDVRRRGESLAHQLDEWLRMTPLDLSEDIVVKLRSVLAEHERTRLAWMHSTKR